MRILLYNALTNILTDVQQFAAENNVAQIKIDYTGTDCATWDKWLDLAMPDGTKSVQLLGSDPIVTFTLTSAHTIAGNLAFQAYAKNGTQRQSFPIRMMKIDKSLNVTIDNTSVKEDLIDYLQAVNAAQDLVIATKQPAGTYATGTGTASGTNTGDQDLSGKVDKTQTVNTKALSGNIVVNAIDIPNTPAGGISAINVQTALNELDSEKADKAQEAWITPTLLNGWVNFDPVGYQPCQYMKDNMGTVFIKGFIKSGTIGTDIFILPIGYRHAKNAYYVAYSNDLLAQIVIGSTGSIKCRIGSNVYVAINIQYKAEQ